MKDLYFDVIKEQYSEELKRESLLSQKAQVYLSILTALLSAVIFKVKDLKQVTASLNYYEMIPLYASFLFLLISAVVVIKSLGIYKYRKQVSLEKLIKQIDDEIEDNEFKNRSAADIVTATKHNFYTNNSRSKLLSIALYAILLGFFTILLFIIIIIR